MTFEAEGARGERFFEFAQGFFLRQRLMKNYFALIGVHPAGDFVQLYLWFVIKMFSRLAPRGSNENISSAPDE